jgi:hypothetical protein
MTNDLVCRACGSDRLTLLWDCAPISGRLLDDMGISSFSPGQLHQCQHCGLGQRLPCLTEEELKQIYETALVGAMNYAFHQNIVLSKSKY